MQHLLHIAHALFGVCDVIESSRTGWWVVVVELFSAVASIKLSLLTTVDRHMYRLEPPYRMDRRQKAGVENPYDGRREDQGDSGIARRPLLLFTAVGLRVWESEMCRKSISIDRITTSSERQSDVRERP